MSLARHLLVHLLHDRFGYSYPDIARLLGASSEKVVMHINRRARYQIGGDDKVKEIMRDVNQKLDNWL